MSTPRKVSFADLTHTGQLVATNTFPLGISYVAAYAKQELGDEIEGEVFRYPEDLSRSLESTTPTIVCFSAFLWNIKLSHEFARRIKLAAPESIIVFGGPNFPGEKDEQRDFLTKYSFIDCFIEFEGEIPFVELFRTLREFDFKWEEFKRARKVVPNIRYLVDDELVAGDFAPKVKQLDDLPSPYISGINDKFFDDVLIPMMQTTRGCPYTCTFCWEGGDYFKKTTRFTQNRIVEELRYMADRVDNVPDLFLTDANFGIFKKDLETAKEIASIQTSHKHSWPQNILSSTAKNHKERTIQIVEILKGSIAANAAVQSTDEEVLRHIERKNVSLDALVTFAHSAEEWGGASHAEIILGLEGDTKKAHIQSLHDMLDAEMSDMSMYQFMMLPGAKSYSKASRDKYQFESRFRVVPRCLGTYEFRGESFSVAEVEEIVVSTNTLSYKDYQDCRDLHLTIETFYNDLVFVELLKFLDRLEIRRAEFISVIHENLINGKGVLSELYGKFRDEEQTNLWDSSESLDKFVEGKAVVDRYVAGELGANELRKFRTIAVFNHMEEMHKVVFRVAHLLLTDRGYANEKTEQYLEELCHFSLMRKTDILDIDGVAKHEYHFDFQQMMESKFTTDPYEAYCPDGVWFEFYHSQRQGKLLDGYINQYGTSLVGLTRILIRSDFLELYCNIDRVSH